MIYKPLMLQKYHSQLYNEKVRKSKISKYISFEYLQQLEKLRNKWKMFMGNNKELYETHLKAYQIMNVLLYLYIQLIPIDKPYSKGLFFLLLKLENHFL